MGLRVLKITKRDSITNKPQAAALGTILLRNEVVVRDLGGEPTATAHHRSYLFVEKRVPETEEEKRG